MLPTVGKTNPREKHGLQSQFSGQLFAYDIFSRWGNSKEINSDLDSLRRLTIVPTDTELAALLPRSLLKTALASERITYSGISALYDSDIQVAAEVTNNLETELAIVNAASLLTGAGGITSRAISLGASRATVIYLTETGITMGAATAIISIGNESINQAVESGSMTENQATITRLGIQAASLYLTARAVKTPVPKSAAAANTSPSLTHPELAGKSAAEIRALASEKGLPPHASKPDKWMDPVTGKERLRLDPGHIDKKTGLPYNDPKAAAPHHHGYEPDGKTKIVDPSDQNPHIPTRQ